MPQSKKACQALAEIKKPIKMPLIDEAEELLMCSSDSEDSDECVD